MKQETFSYKIDDQNYKGYLSTNDPSKKRPAIIVAHAWMGQDAFARNKADELAKLGYVGFAADIYGNGVEVDNAKDASALMNPLFQDRALLQKRMKGAYETIKNHPSVDSSKIGGIGFCFGGLAIIELFRSGVDLKGVTSFHAVLGSKGAKTVPIAKNINGSLLMLHGYNDPLVSTDDLLSTQKEFDDARVDWQMHIYGHTSHAFTNPQAHDMAQGLIYNEKSSDRAWQAMTNFFQKILC